MLEAIIEDPAKLPKITLIVVNKRIHQRMFIHASNHPNSAAQNPMPGTIIDSNLVENADTNQCFDFFLVSQLTTQGCITPTHYFVSINESARDVSKEDIENLTFSLSFMYSNWSGSIKVPSVCQLGHKIAEYHHAFDKFGVLKQVSKGARNPIDLRKLCRNENFLNHCYYL